MRLEGMEVDVQMLVTLPPKTSQATIDKIKRTAYRIRGSFFGVVSQEKVLNEQGQECLELEFVEVDDD